MSVVGGHNDFTGLANLREKAKLDKLAAAKEVGQQFEAYFLKQMISSSDYYAYRHTTTG